MSCWSTTRSRARNRSPWAQTRHVVLAAAMLLIAAAPLAGQDARPSTSAAVIPIRGAIDDIMYGSIERRIDEARDMGANLLIFEMDTPGGGVISAIDICRLIMRQADGNMRTVAWINPEAYSAGAMISVACNEIWMSTGSTIGDCAPIMIGAADLGEAERAKAESPVLQIFREAATRNGYDQLLCRAMVQANIEVWWIERVDTPEGAEPERRFVRGDEKARLIDDVEEQDLREWRLVEADGLLQPIDDESTLLTMSALEAVEFGLARGQATSLADLADKLELSMIPTVQEITVWEQFVMWLNSPLVRGVLFLIMLVGGYLEFQSPGLILPGSVALVAAAIFFGAPYAAGLADIWTIVLLAVGVVLLIVEIYFIPGFGIFGILGLCLIFVSLIGSFVPAEPIAPDGPWWRPVWPAQPGTWQAIRTGITVLSLSVIASFIGLIFLAKYLPQLPIARRLTLGNPEGVTLPKLGADATVALVGDVGIVVGDLKPGGQARFGNDVVDVTTQGQYVDGGTKVQVIRREGMNVFVRPLVDEA